MSSSEAQHRECPVDIGKMLSYVNGTFPMSTTNPPTCRLVKIIIKLRARGSFAGFARTSGVELMVLLGWFFAAR